jgi:alpha-ribazole phosphatase
MKYILIRHAKTQGNIERRYIGSKTDEDLCSQGIEQLRMLQYPKAVAVFVSPMKRCIQTAGIIYPGKPICIVDGFQECDFGDFEGHNYDELKDNPTYQAWLDSGGELPFPGGESKLQFSERCVKWFESAITGLTEGNYAFIIHGGTIMAIMEHFTNGQYYDFQTQNGKGFILNADGSYEVL